MISEHFELILAAAEGYTPVRSPAMDDRQGFVRAATQEIDGYLSGLPTFGQFEWRTNYGGFQGNVSPVPWIRLADQHYSPSTTVGFYLCWLFSGTGDAVHLSLNQGTSEFRSGKWRPLTDYRPVQARAAEARDRIAAWPHRLLEFGATEIDLGSATLSLGAEAASRIRNYEAGHICGFTYRAGSVPDDSALISDLNLMVPLLAELYDTVAPQHHAPIGTDDVASPQAPKAASMQGRSSNAELNKAIEMRAMAVVEAHYEADGWMYDDVSAHMPYDLKMTRDGEELHVEVKGTTTSGNAINLTMGEVAHARNFPRCSLAIVTNITISYDNQKRIVASGGSLSVFDPWQIEDDRLTATQFRYHMDEHPGLT